jgi:ribose 1,5-bisphosphokinase PhnN
MGAPGAGTRTVVERVKEALCDAPNYVFPVVVGTKPGAAGNVEIVQAEEFQRRKVSGELQIFWRGQDDGEYGYRSPIRYMNENCVLSE